MPAVCPQCQGRGWDTIFPEGGPYWRVWQCDYCDGLGITSAAKADAWSWWRVFPPLRRKLTDADILARKIAAAHQPKPFDLRTRSAPASTVVWGDEPPTVRLRPLPP